MIAATAGVGGVGLLASTLPFIASLAPSEKARALGGPVRVEFRGLRPGELLTVAWRGKPVFVLRRKQEMLDSLTRKDELFADPKSLRSSQPEYARNAGRSETPEIAVLLAVCTHLGCAPTFRPTPGASDLGPSWPGGFHCPCHGSKFNLAGRVFKSVPAPTNLTVPAYRIASDSTLLIGVDPTS